VGARPHPGCVSIGALAMFLVDAGSEEGRERGRGPTGGVPGLVGAVGACPCVQLGGQRHEVGVAGRTHLGPLLLVSVPRCRRRLSFWMWVPWLFVCGGGGRRRFSSSSFFVVVVFRRRRFSSSSFFVVVLRCRCRCRRRRGFAPRSSWFVVVVPSLWFCAHIPRGGEGRAARGCGGRRSMSWREW